MKQTFHEVASTIRLTAANGVVTSTRQAREGLAVTTWACGRPQIDYRSRWTGAAEETAAPEVVNQSCARWLTQLERRHPDLMVRILARSRTITVATEAPAHEGHEGYGGHDRTSHVSIMLDGRGRGGAAPALGRSWLGCEASKVTEEDLEAVLEQAMRGSAWTADPWPWRGTEVGLPVVFAPGVGGTAFHEVVGHGLEAEPGRPVPVAGTRLATDVITVVDDATRPGLWGTRRIDDEGMSSTAVTLLGDGTVRGALHVRETSLRSSSARRMDYRSRPLARMSNTYLAPGTDDPAAMLAGSVVLQCVEGGSAEVRPASESIVMRIRNAQLWRDGAPASRHRHLALHFTSGELLYGVEGVGADLAFKPGRCIKESQSVPVSHGAPTFRLAHARVTGAGD